MNVHITNQFFNDGYYIDGQCLNYSVQGINGINDYSIKELNKWIHHSERH